MIWVGFQKLEEFREIHKGLALVGFSGLKIYVKNPEVLRPRDPEIRAK